MTDDQTVEPDEDAVTSRSSESFLEFLRRTTPDGLEFDDVESLRDWVARPSNLGTLDALLGEDLVSLLEELDALRASLDEGPHGAEPVGDVGRRCALMENCHGVESEVARRLLAVRRRLQDDRELADSRSEDESLAP